MTKVEQEKHERYTRFVNSFSARYPTGKYLYILTKMYQVGLDTCLYMTPAEVSEHFHEYRTAEYDPHKNVFLYTSDIRYLATALIFLKKMEDKYG